MVLQSNPRIRRAKRTEGQKFMKDGVEVKGSGNKAGTGRSLYRRYNLNHVKDLGACCKQNVNCGVEDLVVNRLVGVLTQMITLLEFKKQLNTEQALTAQQAGNLVEADPATIGNVIPVIRADVAAAAADLAGFGDNDGVATVAGITAQSTSASIVANQANELTASRRVYAIVNNPANWKCRQPVEAIAAWKKRWDAI